MKAIVIYTCARAVVLGAVTGILYLAGFRSWMLMMLALAISLPLSYALLRKPRVALVRWLDSRVASRREDQSRLRSAMGSDSTEDEGVIHEA